MIDATAAVRPPLWRNVRVLRILGQAAFLALVAVVVAILYANVQANLRRAALPTGFGFLDQPAGFNIRDSDFRPGQPVRQAITVGIGNTLRIALAGIVMATIWGTLLGVARLSANWLVRTASAFYISTVRNIPVLLWIFFFFSAIVARVFPPFERRGGIDGVFVLSNRGLWAPWLRSGDDGLGIFPLAVVLALAASFFIARWRRKVNEATGKPTQTGRYVAATLLVVATTGYLMAGSPLHLSLPIVEGRRVLGGIGMGAPYTALLAALVIYTSSHIAEIVRGSIQAVHRGQLEAAQALALSGTQRMRFVILPQAFRIAVPPISSQYLNLTKNSSLAIAIGYAELTLVTHTVFSQGFPALQSILILMAIYLVLSLLISAATNLANRRLQLVER